MIIIILCFLCIFSSVKIIIAIANCAMQTPFSHQKNKGDKLIVHQTFFSNKTDIFLLTSDSFLVTKFEKLCGSQIFTFTLLVSVTFTSLKFKIRVTWSALMDSVIQR